ncbi:hypothetical protein NS303_18270 [Pantoea ananatis]|jgi:hypothetical protein|uniref:hypothetical protein n=1 Tax=Pantoea ananas TaxID=553 RepID=UPI0007366227|nr:hypothetical protein [Pantoea ananatis]KTR46827.1 hypothetical protein NS303_18270 [Pantoea ananatis]KTR56759.1 hypothetical protein NS311_05785 [Pantoea ananatis]KTR66753.1 hypothetical protein RSA47_01875 [Pantoea ananatis]KTR71283.1 hypothetical protein NS296_07065 [Pantoea ananatis]MBA4823766.1 hypothetical protein [Pantoea ananatis]
MNKQELMVEIDKASSYIEQVMNNENKGGLRVFIDELKLVKVKVINNSLINNPLRGFPRRYAEMYNDYLHTITDVMNKIEKSVDVYLDSN